MDNVQIVSLKKYKYARFFFHGTVTDATTGHECVSAITTPWRARNNAGRNDGRTQTGVWWWVSPRRHLIIVREKSEIKILFIFIKLLLVAFFVLSLYTTRNGEWGKNIHKIYFAKTYYNIREIRSAIANAF